MWDEVTRYGAHKNGYHGGVSPQEAIAPLVILSDHGSDAKNITPIPLSPPLWWLTSKVEPPVTVEPEQPTVDVPVDEGPELPLFDHLEEKEPEPPKPKSEVLWAAKLLESAVYESQKRLARKGSPEDDLVLRSIAELIAQGDSMTPALFAKRIDMPRLRLDGFIARLQRLLNVDGYEVLSYDRQKDLVQLEVDLLKKQFELD